MLTLESFEEAAAKVKEVTQETKLIYSSYFSDMTGNKVYLKPENMQRTGAYKVRGAYYKISTLSDEERNKGLITASAGNHAQGVAYAAHKYGVKAVIVMPTTTPLIKVERTKSYGAEVILHGDVYDEACAHALALAEEKGYTFIHPFDDPAVAMIRKNTRPENVPAKLPAQSVFRSGIHAPNTFKNLVNTRLNGICKRSIIRTSFRFISFACSKAISSRFSSFRHRMV